MPIEPTITDSPTKHLSVITVTNISKSFAYKTAAKINWRRYGRKWRHCPPIYCYIYMVCGGLRVSLCRCLLVSTVSPTKATEPVDRRVAICGIDSAQIGPAVRHVLRAEVLRSLLCSFFYFCSRGKIFATDHFHHFFSRATLC